MAILHTDGRYGEDSDSDSDSSSDGERIGVEGLSADTMASLFSFLNKEEGDEEEEEEKPKDPNAKDVFECYTPGDLSMITQTLARLEKEKADVVNAWKEKVEPNFIPLEAPLDRKDIFTTLQTEGYCRINNILPAELCDRCLEQINASLDESKASGIELNPETGFGDVHARKQRWDMYLRDEGVYKEALSYMLGPSNPNGELRLLFEQLFPTTLATLDAEASRPVNFHEFSALVSEKDAPYQPIHPDSKFSPICPLYTVFIAMQDVEADMGPTLFLPRTNTEAVHELHQKTASNNELLLNSEYYQGTLRKTDCVIMDSRNLHGGGENMSKRRVLMYFTLRNPAHSMNLEDFPPNGSKWHDFNKCLSNFSLAEAGAVPVI